MTEMQLQSLGSMGRAELLGQVQTHQFAMHDLALYLDTHPTDQNALAEFLSHKADCQLYSEAFAARFGALKMQQICEENGWPAWSNTPWPWEKEAN